MNRFNGPDSHHVVRVRQYSVVITQSVTSEDQILPANTYEGMFLLDSSKAAAAWDDTVKHVHDILTKHSSEIVASPPVG